MKKLYEYEVAIYLNCQFLERVSYDEDTKTIWFELIVINTKTNEEGWLIKDTRPLDIELRNWKIKDFLFAIIEVEITNENIHNKTIERLDNSFKVNGKTFLLKDNKFAKLREKVLKEVKQYALH